MRHFLFILSFLFLGNRLPAGNGFSIRIEIDEPAGDTLWLGQWCGDQLYPIDTLMRRAQGDFLLSADSLMPAGMYAVSWPAGPEPVTFLVSEREQRFGIRIMWPASGGPTFVDAPENERFRRFDDYLMRRQPEVRNLTNALRYLENRGEDTRYYRQQLNAIRTETAELARSLLAEDTASMAAALIRARLFSNLPAPSWQDLPALPADPRILTTPVFFDAAGQFLATFAGASGDSLQLAVDTLLALAGVLPQAYDWYLHHFLEQYAPRGPQPREALFVHLVDRFLRPQATLRRAEAKSQAWIRLADRLAPLLPGRTAPDLTIPTLNIAATLERAGDPDERKRFVLDKEVDLRQVNAPFLLLLFWKPDCSHCVESLPILVDRYRQYRSRGLEVLAVCYSDVWGMPDCARALHDSQATEWTNAVDPYLQSRFLQKYNITGTPTLFLLGHRKEILAKNFEIEQLDELLDRWMGAK